MLDFAGIKKRQNKTKIEKLKTHKICNFIGIVKNRQRKLICVINGIPVLLIASSTEKVFKLIQLLANLSIICEIMANNIGEYISCINCWICMWEIDLKIWMKYNFEVSQPKVFVLNVLNVFRIQNLTFFLP